jgi:hypothetical protein
MHISPFLLFGILIATPAFAQQTTLYDPTIKHVPKDGIVTLYVSSRAWSSARPPVGRRCW